jgi:hypothetical protein
MNKKNRKIEESNAELEILPPNKSDAKAFFKQRKTPAKDVQADEPMEETKEVKEE